MDWRAAPMIIGLILALLGSLMMVVGIGEYIDLMQIGLTTEFFFESAVRLISMGVTLLLAALVITSIWWWMAYRHSK